MLFETHGRRRSAEIRLAELPRPPQHSAEQLLDRVALHALKKISV